MKRLQSFLTVLVLMLLSVGYSYAVTITVGPGKDYTTIQAAVTAANGGDIIEVYSATYTENVNVPGGKNGLIIKEASGENAILDGSAVANPKVAFRISSDNVTINGFTIENYNYSGATNVAYGQAQRGVAIEALNASSQHTFTNNAIYNCNWGIYVNEGNSVTVSANTITNINATSFVGTWNQQGGAGITFLSAGMAMDANNINNNSITNAATYGIAYGRIGGNVGADFVSIKNNTVSNSPTTGFFAYGIFNIKQNETVDFENNTSTTNYAALDIASTSATDNEDVTVKNNNFIGTTSPTEVRVSDFYAGDKLWDLMLNHSNVFSNGTTDISNTIVSVEYLNNVITSNATYRYIFNNLDAAITEAELYLGGLPTQGRVYVTDGTYVTPATATVNGIGVETLLIDGQSTAGAIIKNGFAGTTLDIQAGTVEVSDLTFIADLAYSSANAVIKTSSPNTNVHDIVLNSDGPANDYYGVDVTDLATGFSFTDNQVLGRILLGVKYDSQSGVINCNTFTATTNTTNNYIMVWDFSAGAEALSVTISNNTFDGSIYIPVTVVTNIATATNAVNITGNSFASTFTAAPPVAINVTQVDHNRVLIKNNKFDVTFDKYVNNGSLFNINAGFNYWNVATPYATNVPLMFTGAGAANISWLPIYTSATDSDVPTCGFQPDITSLWTPVYTAESNGDDILQVTNKFFLTVEAALLDAETVLGDNEYVYLYLNGNTYAETNASVLTFRTDDITVAAAPAQASNLNVRPTVSISSSFGGPIFDVNHDHITFDSLTFVSGTGYPIYVSADPVDDLDVTYCNFDVSAAAAPDAAIFFNGGGNRISCDFRNSHFILGNGNHGINFGTAASITNDDLDIEDNTFTRMDNSSVYAVIMSQVNDLEMNNNTFAATVQFNAGAANSIDLDISGNTFTNSVNSIEFMHDGVVLGYFDQILIEQNSFNTLDNAILINITGGAAANVNNYADWDINYNSFQDIGVDGISSNVVTPANKINATDNYWYSNYGPWAFAQAPAWHDDVLSTIIANAYGELYNQNAGPQAVPLQDATYIQFVPWWQDLAGTPGTYTGTTFAPIYNSEATPEYYASLIFAIDGTTSGEDIYMAEVPDWNTPGATNYYFEQNTIENNGKNLNIWGEPFWNPTTKIATTGGGALDNMFLIENGTVNFNFLEFHSLASAPEDLGAGINFGVNGLGTIDWCYFNGLSNTSGVLNVVNLLGNTNNITVTNSLFENNYALTAVTGISANNGATLTVDNVEMVGNNLATLGTYEEDGIDVLGNSTNLSLSNSWIYNYNSDNIDESTGLYINSLNTPGNIDVYQNIIENNLYGIYIENGDYDATTSIYNNVIRTNTSQGLAYKPGMAVTALNVENNYWGSNDGPKSRNQAGATEDNTYNEATQGNGVLDDDAFSAINYIPWRRYQTDDLTTKIAGPRFAPIIRTNAANLAQGLYANFTDAIAGLVANQKVYAYAGTYSEEIGLNKSNVQFIGKLAASPYSVGWIIAPNAPQFANAWTNGTAGANAAAPMIVNAGNSGTPLLVDNGAALNNVTFKGFAFNTQATTSPYAANPTNGVLFDLNNSNINFTNNTFLGDAGDNSISFGVGGHTNTNITYNKYTGTGAANFVNLEATSVVSNTTIEFNYSDGGTVNILKNAAGTITTLNVNKNQFTNTAGAIKLNGASGGGFLTGLSIQNNRFTHTNTFAFLIAAGAADQTVAGNDWTTNVVFSNNEVLIPQSAQIAVGFNNPSPLLAYTSPITASCNWWGNVSGPTFAYNPGGSGARSSENVNFAPWLSGNASGTIFEFTPTDACNVGERVWVNNDGNPATKTIIFPSLQMAVMNATVVAGTNNYIFVSDAYASNVAENISVNWNNGIDNTLSCETVSNELKVVGNFELTAPNSYNVTLGSRLRVTGNLVLDNPSATGQFVLGANDLTVEGNITNAGYGAVVTNGAGFLVKENVVTGGINHFPIAYTESNTATPVEATVTASGFTALQNNILKVRTNNTDPVAAKGMGENGYDLNNLWTIDWTNNNGGADPKFAMNYKFLDNLINDPGFTANKTISYAAYWDLAPAATQWTTKKSTSSWNGSNGTQITDLNLETGSTDWALFAGATSFALSDAPTQAKNIQWISGDDRNLQFQWNRNGSNNQFYAILGIEGTMTTPPAGFVPTDVCGSGVSSPWTCGSAAYNFSDGYVDNVTVSNWLTTLFHNGSSTPNDVKVLKVAKYSGSLTENVTVADLDQGTYYTFFVANFNYGDGTTPVASMVTGADGMANYNLNSGSTLNPRTRKTQPALYMTLDASSAFASDVANQPNIVYGTTLPDLTDSTDMFNAANYWRTNGTLSGNVVVNNQFNGDDLTGGNFAQFCQPNNFPANNLSLYFKGYGNNGGSSWNIKYSENNSTYTFTTPFVNSTTARTRSVATKYYLVSAYDGDGKVAKLYDNNKNLQLVFDNGTTLSSAISGTHPTCAGNALSFTSAPTSYPNATFVTWEVSTDNITFYPVVFGTNVQSTGSIGGSNINFTSLDYDDNGKYFRAQYTSNSVCDYPTLGAAYYTTPIKLQIYDNTLTGSTPANANVCSDVTTVNFVSNEGTLVAPNDLTLGQWEVSTDNGGTWNTVSGGDYAVNTVGSPSVSTLTVSNITGKDAYQYRAVWSNGDCSLPVATGAATLQVVTKPVVDALTTPAAKCIGQNIVIASNQTASLSGTVTIQWQMSSDNITWGNVATTGDATVSGETTATVSITPLTIAWDGNYVRVVYTHTENGIDCVTPSNSVQIDVMPTPVFNAIADQTVCQNTNLVVTAVDANPVSWSGNVQWYWNSSASMTGATLMTTGNTYNNSTVTINGASNATFTINSTHMDWNNLYVLVYNNNGSCDGFEAFKVTVDEAPTVGTATVTAGEVCAGGNVTYAVTYTPAATATVVWYYNGTPVVDATSVTGDAFNMAAITTGGGNSSLVLSNVSMAIDGVNVYAQVDNGVCNTVNSNNVAADIETIPVAPTTVSAQNILSHKFDINWTAVANADNYVIEVSDLADYSNIVAQTSVAAPTISWAGMANCGLLPGTTYYFRVRATNQCGNGPWTQSNMVTLTPTVVSINYTVGDGAFGNVEVGHQSPADTYTITYYQLDAGLQVAVPAGYEIKPTGSLTWATGNVDLTPYLTMYLGTPGTPLTLAVDVRFTPSTCGLVVGNLVHTSLETCVGATNFIEDEIITGADDVSGTGVVAAPTVAATSGVVMENTAGTFTSTWTNGNGTNRLVILSSSATLNTPPTNNTSYIVGDVLGNGTVVDVLANPTANSNITVPVDGQNYYVHVWEYNACGANTEQYAATYYTFEPYYLHFTTTIPDQVSGTESGDVTVILTHRDATTYNNPNAAFNVTIAQNPATGTLTTNPTPVQILNAANSTTFKFTWTDACGVDNGNLTANATNINGTSSNTFDLNVTAPTMQSRIIIWVGIPCAASTSFKWTNGNGTGRLVVARDGSLPITPLDFQTYTPNSDWSTRSAANLLGDGTYAVGEVTGSNNDITVTNLEMGHTYYFRVFEYNGCLVQMRRYLTSNATFNPRSRTINCKEGNNLYDIVLDRFNTSSNNAKGILNFNTLYEANISGFELRRMNITDEEMNGILVGSYMNNNELVAAGNTMTGKSYKFTDNSSLLEVGKTYLYTLTAVAFDGTRIDVAEAELTINDDIQAGISEFSMSPVVVTNSEARFDLTVNKAQNVTVTMYDVNGQKVASIANDSRVTRGTHQFTTNIQNVTNGTYMIVVESDGISSAQKFQIVR
ncbi:MAG TPA: fibronectin type III domain-containing protein [Candidatus Kapabacteria bacterium]|nr:fibronectin type III domain-containing protein [Candidatus Kapabacteria bacterium]